MASECLAAIHLCRIRVTRLDASGNPTAGPNNVYVSDAPIQLAVTPVTEAGADRTLTGGCDCIIAAYRGKDKLKWFDLTLDLGKVEPQLIEMMTGATAVTDTGDVVGVWWSDIAYDCSQTPPNVCVEGWQDAWDVNQQATTRPYIHWIWPSSYWQIGPHTLQNDFFQPQVVGHSQGNSNWGIGIFGDVPEAVGSLGGFFYTDDVPPAGVCGYQSFAIT